MNRADIADIYAISLPEEKFLLYSPLRGFSALVNRKALDESARFVTGKPCRNRGASPLDAIFNALSTPALPPPFEPDKLLAPFFLGIIPTRACNMSCRYCDFGDQSPGSQSMDLRTAVAAVDWMADHVYRTGRDKLEIHFFGGEPFVAPDVVDAAVYRARAVAGEKGIPLHLEVSTNGLFDENRAVFVGDYFNSAVISLDGFRETHDRHRPLDGSRGSFDGVVESIRRLSMTPAEVCLRCCISHINVDRMEAIARWFCEELKPSVVNFEIVSSNSKSDAAGLFPPDPYRFAGNCVRACRLVRQFGIQAVYASASIDTVRRSFCPMGKDTLIVSPDGRISSCYLPDRDWKKKGLDLDVGRLRTDGSMDIDMAAIQRLRRITADKPGCEKCFCKWTCAGGCHVRQYDQAAVSTKNDFCVQTRLITACSLLDNLGFRDLADSLLADMDAMETLALNPSDYLVQFT